MESKIYYKYPDSRLIVTFRTTRILEIKIVSLAAINLTKQSKKKPNSSPHLNRMCANNRSGSFVLRGPVSEVAEWNAIVESLNSSRVKYRAIDRQPLEENFPPLLERNSKRSSPRDNVGDPPRNRRWSADDGNTRGKYINSWTVGGKQLAGTRWTERLLRLSVEEGSVWGNVCQSKAGF